MNYIVSKHYSDHSFYWLKSMTKLIFRSLRVDLSKFLANLGIRNVLICRVFLFFHISNVIKAISCLYYLGSQGQSMTLQSLTNLRFKGLKKK